MSNTFFTYNFTFWPRQWYHTCLVYAGEEGSAQLFINSNKIITTTVPRVDRGLRTSYNDIEQIIIGKDFFGKVTDFDIWNRKLGYQEIRDLGLCFGTQTGTIFSWDDLKYNMLEKVLF